MVLNLLAKYYFVTKCFTLGPTSRALQGSLVTQSNLGLGGLTKPTSFCKYPVVYEWQTWLTIDTKFVH